MYRDRSRSPRGGPDQRHVKTEIQEGTEEPVKIKPNFQLSGKLAAASNQKRGVVLKYHEPPECALPKSPWRCYVYNGRKEVDMFVFATQSAYLFGRDRLVADVPLKDDSCSKQHAVMQFRTITRKDEYGKTSRQVKLYIIDLESTNRTMVNGKEIPASKYYELRSEDVVSFGDDPYEYVLLETGT